MISTDSNLNMKSFNLFKYNKKDIIYSSDANTLFEVSKDAVITLKEDRKSKVIEDELNFIKKIHKVSSNSFQLIYINASKDKELNCDTYSKYLEGNKSYIKKYVILELDHGGNFVEKIICFNDFLKLKGCQLVIKENLFYLQMPNYQDCINKLTEKNIGILFYSTIETLEKTIQSSKGKIKATIELRLNKPEDYFRLESLSIPSKVKLFFNSTNINVSKSIFELFNYRLDNLINNKKSVYQLQNLVKLLKINLGSPLPKIDIYYYSAISSFTSIEKKCDNCWAQKICWGTGTYSVFSNHPSITSSNQENCNLIRKFIENVFKAYLDTKKNDLQTNIGPIIYKKKKNILKLINP